jgi:hypothetical protein
MPETIRITVELQHTLGPSLRACDEALSNAVAAYAVKHRLLLEEVGAYWHGFTWSANGQLLSSYLIGQRPLSSYELASLRKNAKTKAARGSS